MCVNSGTLSGGQHLPALRADHSNTTSGVHSPVLCIISLNSSRLMVSFWSKSCSLNIARTSVCAQRVPAGWLVAAHSAGSRAGSAHLREPNIAIPRLARKGLQQLRDGQLAVLVDVEEPEHLLQLGVLLLRELAHLCAPSGGGLSAKQTWLPAGRGITFLGGVTQLRISWRSRSPKPG